MIKAVHASYTVPAKWRRSVNCDHSLKTRSLALLSMLFCHFNIWEILSPDPPKSSSSGWVEGLYDGEEGDTKYMRSFAAQYMVDVKDTARLHVAALMFDDVQNERLFAFAEPFNVNKLLRCIRAVAPRDKQLPEEIENAAEDISSVDTKRSVELLRRMGRQGWTSMEQSVLENYTGLT